MGFIVCRYFPEVTLLALYNPVPVLVVRMFGAMPNRSILYFNVEIFIVALDELQAKFFSDIIVQSKRGLVYRDP